MQSWFHLRDEASLVTPALLFYEDRIRQNISKMIKMAGSALRLRPHVKTYKCRELVAWQMDAGIRSFKCATLAEAQMLVEMGVSDILLAYPLVGASQAVFLALAAKAKGNLSVLIDHPEQIRQWRSRTDLPIDCYIDLNVGMNRTGLKPADAPELLCLLDDQFRFQGWHIYDGHIHASDLGKRSKEVEEAFQPVQELLIELEPEYHGELVCGGSISFPIHAQYPERTLSPGTTLLWDYGYASQFPDLDFDIAACVATQVVSQPAPGLFCLDLGYKAVAAEMKETPVYFPQLPDAKIVGQSEEHLVIETSKAATIPIGQLFYALPWHICPTVAMHESAHLIKGQQITGQIQIQSRKRLYTYE